MQWTDRAFEIWMGDAGKDAPRAHNEAGIEAMAYQRTLAASEICRDAIVEQKAGWLSRAITALTDRAHAPRIARG